MCCECVTLVLKVKYVLYRAICEEMQGRMWKTRQRCQFSPICLLLDIALPRQLRAADVIPSSFFFLSVRWSPSFAFPDCILPIVRCCWTDQNRLKSVSKPRVFCWTMRIKISWIVLSNVGCCRISFCWLKAGKNGMALLEAWLQGQLGPRICTAIFFPFRLEKLDWIYDSWAWLE